MILEQAMMKLSKTYGGVVSSVSKLVMLWKEVGLCMHKDAYMHNGGRWVISHFNSGKSVLKYIKTRKETEKYMQLLHDEVLQDWTFTLSQWESISSEDKLITKQGVVALQKEILLWRY